MYFCSSSSQRDSPIKAMASSIKSVFQIGLLIQTSGTAHGWKIRSHSLYHHKTMRRNVENRFKDYKTVHFIFFLYSLLFIRIHCTDFRELIIRFLVFNNNNNMYKTYNMGNNITCTIHCNYRIAARLCTPEKWSVSGI